MATAYIMATYDPTGWAAWAASPAGVAAGAPAAPPGIHPTFANQTHFVAGRSYTSTRADWRLRNPGGAFPESFKLDLRQGDGTPRTYNQFVEYVNTNVTFRKLLDIHINNRPAYAGPVPDARIPLLTLAHLQPLPAGMNGGSNLRPDDYDRVQTCLINYINNIPQAAGSPGPAPPPIGTDRGIHLIRPGHIIWLGVAYRDVVPFMIQGGQEPIDAGNLQATARREFREEALLDLPLARFLLIANNVYHVTLDHNDYLQFYNLWNADINRNLRGTSENLKCGVLPCAYLHLPEVQMPGVGRRIRLITGALGTPEGTDAAYFYRNFFTIPGDRLEYTADQVNEYFVLGGTLTQTANILNTARGICPAAPVVMPPPPAPAVMAAPAPAAMPPPAPVIPTGGSGAPAIAAPPPTTQRRPGPVSFGTAASVRAAAAPAPTTVTTAAPAPAFPDMRTVAKLSVGNTYYLPYDCPLDFQGYYPLFLRSNKNSTITIELRTKWSSGSNHHLVNKALNDLSKYIKTNCPGGGTGGGAGGIIGLPPGVEGGGSWGGGRRRLRRTVARRTVRKSRKLSRISRRTHRSRKHK